MSDYFIHNCNKYNGKGLASFSARTSFVMHSSANGYIFVKKITSANNKRYTDVFIDV